MIRVGTGEPVTEAQLVRVIDVEAHEGPVYAADEDALYFTTLPRRDAQGYPHVAIKRLQLDGRRFPVDRSQLSTVRADTNAANGMFLDRTGALIVCEQGTLDEPARISRLDRATGATKTLIDGFGGMRLNSPNDVVVRSDGTIWFTDPSYGYLQGFRPEPALLDALYRYDPATDQLDVASQEFDKPNGLAFSPDDHLLYVADNGRPHHILAFGVDSKGRLGRGQRVAVGTAGHPDGLKVDAEGRLYASSLGGIQVFTPSGVLIDEIALPGAVNFTFGGPENDILFITADSAIWATHLNTKGAA